MDPVMAMGAWLSSLALSLTTAFLNSSDDRPETLPGDAGQGSRVMGRNGLVREDKVAFLERDLSHCDALQGLFPLGWLGEALVRWFVRGLLQNCCCHPEFMLNDEAGETNPISL